MINEKPSLGIAVDGWCSGNPGPGGYRGVCLASGKELFRNDNLGYCTNNIAEFIGIVHGLGYCKKVNDRYKVVYSDSEIAISWVNKKNCGTSLFNNGSFKSDKLKEKIRKCEMFLYEEKRIPLLVKWNTKEWGEVPADFGNKR